ncbi:hypothetical protein GCM10022396_31540 [Flavivirga amylovorans]|uniref:T9SS type A sorting domain-containing protein n=1 Tax=Flavivirga amylovorans TaxID=870486 RepID=UPI0026E0A41F|nr:T9SS type A sorting domain-containing protein [Flavivirga amylovorans]
MSDNTPYESPTYTFSYITTEAIGAGSNTPNIFYMTLPDGFPSITNTIDYPSLLDSNIVLKVNGSERVIDATTFGPIGGSWANGIQMSTLGGSPGLTIPAGSSIEIIVTGIIINPTAGDYTFKWRTAEANGVATEWHSADLNFDILSPNKYVESSLKVGLYPNPSKGITNISVSNDSKIEITDLHGKRILEKEIDTGVSQLVLSDFKIGTYILKVEGSNHSIAYKKLVKK